MRIGYTTEKLNQKLSIHAKLCISLMERYHKIQNNKTLCSWPEGLISKRQTTVSSNREECHIFPNMNILFIARTQHETIVYFLVANHETQMEFVVTIDEENRCNVT